jgi:hypothetical protein
MKNRAKIIDLNRNEQNNEYCNRKKRINLEANDSIEVVKSLTDGILHKLLKAFTI